MWGNYYFDYACSLARGRSGGLISMWDPNNFVKDDIWCDDAFIIVKGRWKNSVGACYMINIYGPHDPLAKSALWDRIRDFMHCNRGKYILFGDMNEVRNAQERHGSIFSSSEAQVFNNFISCSNLIDLTLGGHSFTWMNKQGTKLSKLDRFLISDDVYNLLPDIQVTALDRLWSDHIPILLHCNKRAFGPVPFKIYHSWFNREGFDDLIISELSNLRSLSSHEKIKALKPKIKQWHAFIRSNEYSQKNDALKAIKTLEDKIEEGSASNEDCESRLKLLHDLDKLDTLEAMDSFQKARIKWDVKGDENTKFFHCLINQKRRCNSIKGIMHEGAWVTDPQLANASMEEVKDAVWDCGSDKAPGPDGYTFAFIKRFWDNLKTDILDFVNAFLATRKMPLGSDSSFITLIPKVSNPINVNDFRPISLIGTHYKIIAKVLANRLSKVVDKLINHEKSTFIKSRQILDGPLILSEAIDWYKKRKKKMLLFKVDFEKAFDSVSWRYLDYMLCKLGFGLSWRSWIKACLESSRTSILINGSPTSEFNVRRGLRQGDPLSPFLFIIIMEGLHVALTDSVRSGLIRGINFGSPDLNLSHLFFADDVIITTDWNVHDLDNVIRIFQVFFLASGLKINIHKSSIYGIGVASDDVQIMAANTGCSAGTLPLTYLGLPIGSNMSLIVNWKPLVDKFRLKLSSWKANLLSYGGRLTLIKVVLGSLGIYFFSLFKAPVAVLKALESARASFFWGGSTDSKKLSWRNMVEDCWNFQLSPFELHFTHGLYSISEQDKDCLVMDRISNGQWSWNWSRDNIGIRNSSYLNNLLEEISHIEVRDNADKCFWSLDPNGSFSVADLRRLIDDRTLPSLGIKTTWDKSLPRKVNIFIWRLKLNRLPLRLNLSSRGIEIPEISCPLCNGNVESNTHIFYECTFAKEIWRTTRMWCEDSFPLFKSNDHWIDWLISWPASCDKKHRVFVIIAASLWFIWRYRNDVTFSSHSLKKSDVFDFIRLYSFSWLKHRGRKCLLRQWTISLPHQTKSIIDPREVRKYGDYVCFNVFEICVELRKNNPDLFDERKPKDIAMLHSSWIAKRVEKMFNDGIDTCAPVIYESEARAVFLSRTNTQLIPGAAADMLRADFIKDALARIFLYSRTDILDAGVSPSNNIFEEGQIIR
ncbi:putative RNA-directed DNA polymerase, eukaryota, reverse transcriptase zinc-binding domain protein, partial [Tanacetum coccineum]